MNYILGAGITGLIAQYILKCPILEQSEKIGGLCRLFRQVGFTFDCTGHYLHVPYTQRVVSAVDNCSTLCYVQYK